jgi:4-hydroxy-tetrahydrodipicolinate synthase
VTPYYNKPTPNGLVLHYKEIAKAVDLPIIIYNVPGRTGSNVSPAVILRIAREVPSVVAVKEASGSLNQMMEIINEVEKNGPKEFAVLAGDDALALPLIAAGGKGCISVVCNEVPKLFSDIIHFALGGNFEQAQELHYKLLELMNVNFIESNPIPVKTALSMMGMITESLRLPLTTIEDKNRSAVEKALKGLNLI